MISMAQQLDARNHAKTKFYFMSASERCFHWCSIPTEHHNIYCVYTEDRKTVNA